MKIRCVLAFMLIVLAGCASGVAKEDHGGVDLEQEERLAGSMTELLHWALDYYGENLEPFEREVFERAIKTGRIDTADYEAGHSEYVQCLSRHGFHPEFRKTPEGIYIELPYEPGDHDRFDAAGIKCSMGFNHVQIMYRRQQVNPSLLADERLVAIQCLRRLGYIDSG